MKEQPSSASSSVSHSFRKLPQLFRFSTSASTGSKIKGEGLRTRSVRVVVGGSGGHHGWCELDLFLGLGHSSKSIKGGGSGSSAGGAFAVRASKPTTCRDQGVNLILQRQRKLVKASERERLRHQDERVQLLAQACCHCPSGVWV